MPGLGKGHFNGSATNCLRLLLPVWFNRCCRCEIGMCGVSFRYCSFEELVNRHHKKDIAWFRKRDVADRIGYRARIILTLMKLHFISRMQFAFCLVGILMSITSFVGIFFNPLYVLFCIMSIVLTIGCYRERIW